jgi:hypothetical protein
MLMKKKFFIIAKVFIPRKPFKHDQFVSKANSLPSLNMYHLDSVKLTCKF